jgi:chitin synthase
MDICDDIMIDIEIDNYVSKLIINEYDDIIPINSLVYFGIDNADPIYSINEYPTLLTGITFFNEESVEMRSSLISIADNISKLHNINHRCVIIGDGYKYMSSTMKLYLKALYCSNNREISAWDNMMKKMSEYDANNIDKTYIVQKVLYDEIRNEYKYNDLSLLYNNDNINRNIQLCLILKVKNRKKHNSHQWILSNNGFINNIYDKNNAYILLSDCGTIFGKNSIKKIILFMENNNNCVGCTGVQQIMSSAEQHNSDNIWSFLLRKIQYVDYMLSYYIQLVAFSITGYLPVLPGPCVLFRISDLSYKRKCEIDPLDYIDREIINYETPMTHYFNIINLPENKDNLVTGNIKLAEDRIPSYSIITHNKENAYTALVDGAIFKSQSEMTLKQFLFQRRRWINGSLYCNIWNLFVKPEYIWNSNMKLSKKIFVFIMLTLQLLNNIFSLFFPALISLSLYFSLNILQLKELYVYYIIISYNIYILLFCWIHRYIQYVKPLVCTLILINIISLVIIFYGYIYKIIYYRSKWIDILFMCILIFVIGAPFIIVLISFDLKEFLKLILYFIPYIFFLPTLLGTFTLYAYSRSYDISWGNRIAENVNIQNDISNDSATILLFVNITNIILIFCIINYPNTTFMIILMIIMITPLVMQLIMVFFHFLIKRIKCN